MPARVHALLVVRPDGRVAADLHLERTLTALRAQSPFTRAEIPNLLSGETDEFFAVTGYAELIEISRHPQDYCSGKGSTNISDMPPEALRSSDTKTALPPLYGAMLKNEQDVHLFERLAFLARRRGG